MVSVNIYITSIIHAKNGFFFYRYEVRTHMTKNQKWDGVGYSVKDKRLTPVLIEFSEGIKFANNDIKENHDLVKLASAFKRSIKYVTATTDLTVKVSEYVVRFYGT